MPDTPATTPSASSAPVADGAVVPAAPGGADRWTMADRVWGTIAVGLAAVAMVGTLPGRTHGLGMITKRLLDDPAFGLTETGFSTINLGATLIGALFCLPCGWLIDRIGLRVTLTGIVVGLAVTVLAMTHVTSVGALFFLITLTRGFGQSALSVVSLTIVGKWYTRRLGLAMAIYTLLMSVGFIAAFMACESFKDEPWRVLWDGMGWVLLLGLGPAALLLTKAPPRGRPVIKPDGDAKPEDAADGHTLFEAMATPAFWVFGVAVAAYGLIAAGTSLFNELILAELGFDDTTYYRMMKLTTLVGLLTYFPAGLIAQAWSLGRTLSVSLVLMAASLVYLPFVETITGLTIYAIGMGVAGSTVGVLFFTFWGVAYGRPHLGRIQGVGQMLTVLASALGPRLFTGCLDLTGSYLPAFTALGVVVALLGVVAWRVPIPTPRPAACRPSRTMTTPLN